ncbi:MAG: hypothetical protein MJ059_00625 [Lachnospiraceae bacterium]|nr:hypothetical protein [Lachnospiraceae bacterium]
MDVNESKVYVDVTVDFDSDGRMFPRTIKWEDNRIYKIDRVLSMRPSFSRKAGGQGDLYTIKVQGQEKHLYFERNEESFSGSVGRWFMARA